MESQTLSASVHNSNDLSETYFHKPPYQRAKSVNSTKLSAISSLPEQYGIKSEFLFHSEKSLQSTRYRSNSVGGLSMVKEEGASFRSFDKKGNAHAHEHTPIRRRGKKSVPAWACFLHPFKSIRDQYVNCCFQIAGTGDLSGLVGGGHTVTQLEAFPAPREDSDQEKNDFDERARRRGRKGGKTTFNHLFRSQRNTAAADSPSAYSNSTLEFFRTSSAPS